MPIIARVVALVVLAIVGFLIFRHFSRSGKAVRAANLEETDKTISEYKSDAQKLREQVDARKRKLRAKQEELEKELLIEPEEEPKDKTETSK